MPTTYQYSLAENGSLLCTRTQPAHEQTRGLFIDDRDNGYGATGITGDWVLPANAINGFGFFEYYQGDTETYHRVLVPDILGGIDSGQPMDDPAALDVRHAAWPGMDKREIELQILARAPARNRGCPAPRQGRRKPAKNGSASGGSRKPGGEPRWKPPSTSSTALWRRRLQRPWRPSLAPGSGSDPCSTHVMTIVHATSPTSGDIGPSTSSTWPWAQARGRCSSVASPGPGRS